MWPRKLRPKNDSLLGIGPSFCFHIGEHDNSSLGHVLVGFPRRQGIVNVCLPRLRVCDTSNTVTQRAHGKILYLCAASSCRCFPNSCNQDEAASCVTTDTIRDKKMTYLTFTPDKLFLVIACVGCVRKIGFWGTRVELPNKSYLT